RKGTVTLDPFDRGRDFRTFLPRPTRVLEHFRPERTLVRRLSARALNVAYEPIPDDVLQLAAAIDTLRAREQDFQDRRAASARSHDVENLRNRIGRAQSVRCRHIRLRARIQE